MTRQRTPTTPPAARQPGRWKNGTRTPARKAADRRKAARMAVQGYTTPEIAAALGVHHTTVVRDLRALRERWESEAAKNLFEVRSKELAKVDLLEAEAWAAFDAATDSEGATAAWHCVAKAISLRAKIYGLDRLQDLHAEHQALAERTRQAIDTAVNTVAKYLTPAEFTAFVQEMETAIEQQTTGIYAALPPAPAAVHALPLPDQETDA